MTTPSSLSLTVLGAGPAWSDRPGSSGAGYLLRSPSAAVLLDLGQGSFPRLAQAIEPGELDAVVISHLHPDHFIDLVPLRHYLAYQRRPPGSVRVIAPEGLAGRMDALHDQPGFTAVSLDVEPFGDGPVRIGDLTLEARRVTHTDNSHAVRIAAGERTGLVYSGDCGVAADLAPLIRPGDTLLVEVSFGAGPVPPGALHLNAEAIAGLVAATRPGLVLLTHLQMALDRERPVEIVRAAFSGAVRLVEPGDVIDLPRT
ncbi:MAG TPA: MBL fold metallo-hydrolase [Candidatus Limnocylindrales bacterium]|nr:MBL fold metallo-hydrolase [Candidatus Limnocylindrales bacterium]